jgi:hypothetical protein
MVNRTDCSVTDRHVRPAPFPLSTLAGSALAKPLVQVAERDVALRVQDGMDMHFDDLRRWLEAAGMPDGQAESLAQAIGTTLALQERELQKRVCHLESELYFARKLAQTSMIAVTGLAILLMFVLG